MPTVAKFDGIKIMFYYNEHPPPHFHAKFAQNRAAIDIETLTVMEGLLPPGKLRLIIAWASSRKLALHRTFMRAGKHDTLEQIL